MAITHVAQLPPHIKPGVKIGDGVIISSRSVVTRDVTPYTIVGGNPAQPIKQRFDADVVAQLQHIAWWNWPAQKISQHLKVITAGNIAALKQAAVS